VDFDLYNLHASDAEYQLLVRKLAHDPAVPPVFWTPQNTGHWVAARADVIEEVLNKPEFFSSRTLTPIKASNPNPPFAPLMIDPPDHTKYRNLIAPAMSPQAVEALGVKARALAIELIEGFQPQGRCEFIGDFAAHLPIAIFMSMVDLPAQDRVGLLEIADALVRTSSLEKQAVARQQLSDYTGQKIKERRANPGKDLISHLVASKVDGEPIDDGMLQGMLNLLMLAGLDTVAATMGFMARHLALNPEFRHALQAKPELIPRAVEELLRRYSIATPAREVIKEVELGGAHLKVGDMVLTPLAAFGLDELRYENSETVDLERKNRLHGAFGGGVHRCMGSMLARVELRIFLEEWLKRIPDFRIQAGAEVIVHPGSVASILALPLEWDV
jgi:cytochrome P450